MPADRRQELAARWQLVEAELKRLHDLAAHPGEAGSFDVTALEHLINAELDEIEFEMGEAYLDEQKRLRDETQ